MTSSHTVDREEVMAFLDGELAVGRAAEVEAHIGGCSECRALAESLRQVSGSLTAWAVEPAPFDLAPRLRDTIAGRAVGQPESAGSWLTARTWFGLPRWASVALPAAAILALAVWWPSADSLPNPRRAANTLSFANEPMATRTEDKVDRGVIGGARGLKEEAAPAGGSPQPLRGFLQQGQQGRGTAREGQVFSGPMIARTVSLSIVTDHFADTRAAIERLTADVRGTIASLTMTGDPPARRSLHATLRVPADRLDAALLEVRKLGNVRQESQSSDDVSDVHRDLVVRISNATKEEARLNDLLVNRTGRLQDVLEVEREVTRVRGDIEQMKSQEIAMRNRVTYATITVDIAEAYKAEVGLAANSLPISARLRNALVEGWSAAADTAFGLVLFILQAGPSILLWMLVFGPPAWWVWRRTRRTV